MPSRSEKRPSPYQVHLTRRSQLALESLSIVERTRVLSAIQGLSHRRAVAGSAKYKGEPRDGTILFEVSLGNLKLVFKISDSRKITITDILQERPRRPR